MKPCLEWNCHAQKLFTFPLIEGNPQTALSDPFTVVLTQEMAEKYFGAEDAFGKVLHIENLVELMVTGVLRNLPRNVHFRFGFLGLVLIGFAIAAPVALLIIRQWLGSFAYHDSIDPGILLIAGGLPSSSRHRWVISPHNTGSEVLPTVLISVGGCLSWLAEWR